MTPAELKSFVEKCVALDHMLLASLLDKKLAPGSAPASQMVTCFS